MNIFIKWYVIVTFATVIVVFALCANNAAQIKRKVDAANGKARTKEDKMRELAATLITVFFLFVPILSQICVVYFIFNKDKLARMMENGRPNSIQECIDMLEAEIRDKDAYIERLKGLFVKAQKERDVAVSDILFMLSTRKVCWFCADYARCHDGKTDDRDYCNPKYRGVLPNAEEGAK